MQTTLWLTSSVAGQAMLRTVQRGEHVASVSGRGVSFPVQVVATGVEGLGVRLSAAPDALHPVGLGAVVRVDIRTPVRKLNFITTVVLQRELEWTLGWPVAVQADELRAERRWAAFQLGGVRFACGPPGGPSLPLQDLSPAGICVRGHVVDLPLRVEDRLEGWLLWPKGAPTPVGGKVRSVALCGNASVCIGAEFFPPSPLSEASLNEVLGVPAMAG